MALIDACARQTLAPNGLKAPTGAKQKPRLFIENPVPARVTEEAAADIPKPFCTHRRRSVRAQAPEAWQQAHLQVRRLKAAAAVMLPSGRHASACRRRLAKGSCLVRTGVYPRTRATRDRPSRQSGYSDGHGQERARGKQRRVTASQPGRGGSCLCGAPWRARCGAARLEGRPSSDALGSSCTRPGRGGGAGQGSPA